MLISLNAPAYIVDVAMLREQLAREDATNGEHNGSYFL